MQKEGLLNILTKTNLLCCQWLLTHSTQKVTVEGIGHEGVRQLSEPTFNQACDRVDGVVL